MAEYKVLKKATSRQEWLKLRQMGIGGSDAGAIMGLNIHKKRYDVFRDKMSHQLREFSNAAMRFGSVFEPYILDYIRPRYNETIEPGDDLGTLHHIDRTWQIANIDGLLTQQGAPTGVGLEIKTCAHSRHHYWRDGVPPMYNAQVQHYMSVMGWDRFDVWLCVTMKDRKESLRQYDCAEDQTSFARQLIDRCLIERYVVHRDETFIHKMNTAERTFWDMVESARQHDPYFKNQMPITEQMPLFAGQE